MEPAAKGRAASKGRSSADSLASSTADRDDVDDWSHSDDVLNSGEQAASLGESKLAALQTEADAHGYGKMYAAMGGGRDGLEACAAGALFQDCACGGQPLN